MIVLPVDNPEQASERCNSVRMRNGASHAWIDESVRLDGAEPPMYILGGPLAAPDRADELRRALRALHVGPSKLHWRELDRRSRLRVIDVVRDLSVRYVVVTAAPVEAKRQERARALCLERLCWTLDRDHGVSLATLEARPPVQMGRDLDLINAFRGRGALSAALRLTHGQPSDEPMLWLADIVVGAVGDAHVGRPEWLDGFGDSICVDAVLL
jgi:hypothetical protein